MHDRDSDRYDSSDENFQATGDAVAYRAAGKLPMWRRLYRVTTPDVYRWDLGEDFEVPAGFELMAIGSKFGGFGYVLLKVTGRKETNVDGSSVRGVRVKVVGNLDGDRVEWSAHLVKDHFSRERLGF